MSRPLISRLVIFLINIIIISSTLNANQLLRSNGGERPTLIPMESNDKKNNPLDHLLLIGTEKNFDSNNLFHMDDLCYLPLRKEIKTDNLLN